MSFKEDAENDIIQDIVTSHEAKDYVKRPVGDVEFRFSSKLTEREIELAKNEIILPYKEVWESIEQKVSYPKQCKYSFPIPTEPGAECYTKPYRQSPDKSEFLNKYADELVAHGIIEPAMNRSCISQALAVKKPGAPPGVFRFVCDYRERNKTTRTDRMGLPFIWDLAHELAGCMFITELDLSSGYWQIGIIKADRYKTAFMVSFNGLDYHLGWTFHQRYLHT